MADDQHDEIGGQIVGAMLIEALAAMLAMRDGLEIAPEEAALAAMGAMPQGSRD